MPAANGLRQEETQVMLRAVERRTPAASTPVGGAIVCDAEVSSALAGLRALGHAGIETVAAGSSWGAAALYSRHATHRKRTPAPERDPQGFVAALAALAPAVVYPSREETIDVLLAAGPEQLGDLRLPYPAREALDRIRHKVKLAEHAAAAGVGAPRTLASGTAGELAGSAATLTRGGRRVVVKPARPAAGTASACVAASSAELVAALRGFAPMLPLVVQEHEPGEQLALALVLDREGRIVERFQHVVRRTWPRDGGATSMALSVAPEPALLAAARRLLHDAGYWGLAQLDVARRDDGGFSVIDVNPRFYTSMPLAAASGVNLPQAWHAVAGGGQRERPEPTPYRTGVAYRWLEADLTVLRGRLRPLPQPSTGAVWDAGDPLAGAVLAAQAAARRAAQFARGRRSRLLPR